jgi:uncharacterized protein (TIGR02231 family)
MVTQVSGEDWSNVKMTLSTATPSVVARAPELDPLMVMLAAAQPQQVAGGPGKAEEYAKGLVANRDQAARAFMGNSSVRDRDGQNVIYGDGHVEFQQNPFGSIQRDNIFALRRAASELQQAELSLDKSVTTAVRMQPTESVTVTYVLPDATSLPSRADQQLVGIASTKLSGEFYKLAVPVLTSYIYNEAKVTNASKQLLLAGPTMSYLDGEFVGAGELPTVAAGEQFTVGFGIDTSLRVQRELVDKTEATSGGNKITGFEYRITLENFGATPADVRVQDRVPVSSGKDLKVTVVSSDPKPIDDADADAMKKKGLLTWNVNVKPQSIGTDAMTIKYSLSIEHDRNLSLVGTAK